MGKVYFFQLSFSIEKQLSVFQREIFGAFAAYRAEPKMRLHPPSIGWGGEEAYCVAKPVV